MCRFASETFADKEENHGYPGTTSPVKSVAAYPFGPRLADFGPPVITSNQATLWGALRHARVEAKKTYWGHLFTL